MGAGLLHASAASRLSMVSGSLASVASRLGVGFGSLALSSSEFIEGDEATGIPYITQLDHAIIDE